MAKENQYFQNSGYSLKQRQRNVMEAECYLLFKVGDPRMTPQTLIHILITDPGKLTDPPNRTTAFMHSSCGSESD